MTAIILSIGDELVLGQTVDTNSAWLSQHLARVGCLVLSHITVPDEQAAIEDAVRSVAPRCHFLLVTGGIGPTPDDLTRQALAAVMKVPLEMNEQWLAELHKFFAARNRPMPEMNRIQAMIPRGATMLFNHAGTAAGIEAELLHALAVPDPSSTPRASNDNLELLFGTAPGKMRELVNEDIQQRRAKLGLPQSTRVFVLPGVPKEMKLMFERYVLPIIREKSSGGVILSKTLHTFGLGESAIAELLGPLMERTRNPSVGTTVSGGAVSVRVNARFSSHDEAQRQLDETTRQCYSALGDLIFGEDDTTLSEAVAALLKSRSKTVTTAESCTGGLLAKYLTDVPGSSSYYKQGWITYSNESKYNLLNVTIGQEGAVSYSTVAQMASGALVRAKTDYALAITGIAGPEGGTPAKPVGTVFIALASQSKVEDQKSEIQARTFLFAGDREMIRDRAAKMALTMLRFHLLGKPLPF